MLLPVVFKAKASTMRAIRDYIWALERGVVAADLEYL